MQSGTALQVFAELERCELLCVSIRRPRALESGEVPVYAPASFGDVQVETSADSACLAR